MDTVFHNLLSSLSIRIITHGKDYLNDARLGNECHYFGMLICGNAHFQCDYCNFELKTGEIVYIPKGLPYTSHWFSEKEVRLYSIGFNFLEPERNDLYLLQKFPASQSMQNLISAMYSADEPFASVSSFYSLYQQTNTILQKDERIKNIPSVFPAIQHLRSHCCEDVSVSQLAKLCRMSESYFYPVFKKETGCTPVQYKNRLKCQLAVEMLKTTDYTLDYISDQLHFSTPAFLRKILKRETGKTPKQIRKEQASL